jgi:dolichol kinase
MFSTGDIAGLILVYSYVFLVVMISYFAKRRFPGCGYRKIIHILVGNIAFLWWVFEDRYIMAFLAAFPFVILLLLVTPLSPLRKFDNTFLQMATRQGHGYGLVYYAISWTILALLLFDDRLVASIGIMAMSYGDGVGGLVGKQYGRRKIWKEKSYVGTVAVMTGTFVATSPSYPSIHTSLVGSGARCAILFPAGRLDHGRPGIPLRCGGGDVLTW